MNLKLFIPSRGRAHRQPTLEQLPLPARRSTYLVVPPAEVAEYKALHPTVTVLGCKEDGITPTRDWILRWAKRQGPKFNRIAMLDDDIVLQRHHQPKPVILPSTAGEVMHQLSWLDAALTKFAHASFAPRFFDYTVNRPHFIGTRCVHVLGFNVDMVAKAKATFGNGMPEYAVMEDYNMTLQLLKAGLPNIVSLLWRASPGTANANGGCSTWRNLERINRSARRLAELHAPFVKLRPKKAWRGIEGKEQLDVYVLWKQCLKKAGGYNP